MNYIKVLKASNNMLKKFYDIYKDVKKKNAETRISYQEMEEYCYKTKIIDKKNENRLMSNKRGVKQI